MAEDRRGFVRKMGVVIAGFGAGCVGSSGAGSESATPDTTNHEQPSAVTATRASTSPPDSETVADTVDARSEPSPTASRTAVSTRSGSDCRRTATRSGTAVHEAAPADIVIENDTDDRQTVRTTVTRLPADTTARPPEAAPHEPLDLPGQPTVFARTTELPANGGRAYRCTGVDFGGFSGVYQVTIAVHDGPTGAFDWDRNTASLDVRIEPSAIGFSVRQGR